MQRWAGKVTIIGVAWQGSEESMQRFVGKHGLTFSQLNDDAAAVYAHFDVPGQPAWVFIDSTGVGSVVLGSLDDAQLDEMLGRLV